VAAKKKAPAEPSGPPTLEDLLTSRLGFGLPTATPVQRAVCRAIEGRPLGDLASEPNVLRAFGGAAAVEALPLARPREVYLIAGIRAAKSLIAAAAAVLSTQTVDISQLGAGEMARVSVVSLSIDTAKVVYGHILGNVQASPVLRQLLVGEPTADTVTLRHPSGRPIEIKVVAGSKAGGTLVARWSAGVIFDEAPRMSGDEAVVNFSDARAAVLGRLLPGAQLLAIGSPWEAEGPVYETVMARHGAPTASLVVVRAPADVMNPVWWTAEKVDEFRRDNPELARTEIDAEFGLVNGASFFVASDFELLFSDGARRDAGPGDLISSAVDLGFVRNSATLAVLSERSGVADAIDLQELRPEPTRALVPSVVCSSFAAALKARHCGMAVADGHYRETLREHTDPVGVSLYDGPGPGERFLALRLQVRAGTLRVNPALPEAQRLRRQLGQVRPRLAPGGVLSVVLPEDTDGSHCDLADVLARAAWGRQRYGGTPVPAPVNPIDALEASLIARLETRANEEKNKPWYRRQS
jgi:hypothetical protein